IVEQWLWERLMRGCVRTQVLVRPQYPLQMGNHLPSNTPQEPLLATVRSPSLVIRAATLNQALVQVRPWARVLDRLHRYQIHHRLHGTFACSAEGRAVDRNTGLASGRSPAEIGFERGSVGEVIDGANGRKDSGGRMRANTRDGAKNASLPRRLQDVFFLARNLLAMLLKELEFVHELFLLEDQALQS